jgi:hypothetical protein
MLPDERWAPRSPRKPSWLHKFNQPPADQRRGSSISSKRARVPGMGSKAGWRAPPV